VKIIRIIYNVISIILTVAIILITLLALLLGISGIDRDNPKSVFGFRAFIVLSGSMAPTFDEGSIIIIQDVKTEKLKIGDILTFIPQKSTDPLTHRIVEIQGETGNKTFITKGDANDIVDNPVEPEQILGRTVFYMNGLGTFILQLRTPLGIAGMIAVIIVGLFIIPYLLSPREEKKRERETKIKTKKLQRRDCKNDQNESRKL